MLKYIALVAAFATTSAFAAPTSPWFVTAGIGQSSYSDACNGLDSCNDKDSAFRLGVGYQIQPNYRAELTFLSLGEASAQDYVPGSYREEASIGVQTIAAQLSASTALSNSASLYGKLGVTFNKSEVKYSYSDAFENSSVSESESNAGLIGTLGVSMNAMPQMKLNAQVDFLPKGFEYKNADADSDVTLLSVGLEFAF